MKSRLATFLAMLIFAVAAFGLYLVKYRVLAVQDEIAEVQRKLDEERESLHVAAAEWAYLTRPERLQRLSLKYLRMQPVDARQVASFDALDRPVLAAPRERGLVFSASVLPAEGE